MAKSSTKERIRARRQREARQRLITIVVIGAVVIGGVAFLISRAQQISPPAATPVGTAESLGQVEPTMESVQHVPEGSDPGPHNTDPPTSGPHYSTPLSAGFYEEDALETYGPFPEGYLIHSLEHGYVVFWYNCAALSEPQCDDLKDQIQDVMQDAANFKVIGFPRPSLEVPVAITTWGRTLRMQQFDPGQALQFVQTYRGVAPEPQGP